MLQTRLWTLPILLLGMVLLLAAPTPLCLAYPPGAYDVLEQVRLAYGELEAYGDTGTIESTTIGADKVTHTTTLSFTSLASARHLLWELHEESRPGQTRTLWTNGAETFLYDRGLSQHKKLASAAAALANNFGDGGFEALIVPALLAGHDAALGNPEGAALDPPEPCFPEPFPRDTQEPPAAEGHSAEGRQCYVLTLSYMGGDIESVLWIDVEHFLVHRLEVDRFKPGIGSAGEHSKILVRHDFDLSPKIPNPFFEPPEGSRLVATWKPPSKHPKADTSGDGRLANTPDADLTKAFTGIGFTDEVTVALQTLVLRAIDRDGEPLRNLQPEDLIAKIGNIEIPIYAVDWISSEQQPLNRDPPKAPVLNGRKPSNLPPLPQFSPGGRLVIFFIQANFEPTYMRGQMRLLPHLEKMLEELPVDDRVAVLSFDSHLKLWHDLTYDRQAIAKVLQRAIRPGGKPQPQTAPGLSLLKHFDVQAGRRVANLEKALLQVAQTLDPLPGEKDLIYLGYGFGDFNGGQVNPRGLPYLAAASALQEAGVTVFSLDVTEADWHALEAGMQQASGDTGGRYYRTFRSEARTTQALGRTLVGHYVITLDGKNLEQKSGRVKITLREKKGTVLIKPGQTP